MTKPVGNSSTSDDAVHETAATHTTSVGRITDEEAAKALLNLKQEHLVTSPLPPPLKARRTENEDKAIKEEQPADTSLYDLPEFSGQGTALKRKRSASLSEARKSRRQGLGGKKRGVGQSCGESKANPIVLD